METSTPRPSQADLRALLARNLVRIYEIAPAVGLHPNSLGRMLRESLPMPPEVAQRIQRAVENVRADRVAHERENRR